jgi:hypothetical protein
MISLIKINLSQLIRGKYFIVLYILLKNKYRITLSALINSRVNSFAFIDITYINNISTFLNLKP